MKQSEPDPGRIEASLKELTVEQPGTGVAGRERKTREVTEVELVDIKGGKTRTPARLGVDMD